ncbi:VOC family protein [Frigidibacter sp. ROC022]|uniref:VOC family protein n=1 Tax=Frigidibacter sp. ROC022 TaxID=2971796 RepID=UPI00215B1E82|nr:VOC family protein [Frigidibacter sp. ROC022]MCR8724301.1 VOC family protein [Frigidibacter sp. ROC022]
MPSIDAVAVSTTDMARSIAFYSALGFDFTGADPSQDHVEPKPVPGSARLMIDSARLLESISNARPRPASHSAFSLLCDSPGQVDALAGAVAEAGFTVTKPPWDAFWGQRYAIVQDPDGYLVDLFAPL